MQAGTGEDEQHAKKRGLQIVSEVTPAQYATGEAAKQRNDSSHEHGFKPLARKNQRGTDESCAT